MTVWEIFSDGAAPYHGMSNSQVIEFVTAGKRLEKPWKCPLTVYAVMEKCWQSNAPSRPPFTAILSDLKVALKNSVATVEFKGTESSIPLVVASDIIYSNIN